jgi:hypothetical protein
VIILLADVNIEGHVLRLASRMQSDEWREFWDYLDVRLLTFHDIGLVPDATDAEVWQTCQQQRIYLITNNRNDDGPDSLESTIRTQNSATSLPVFTLSDANEVIRNRDYAARVVESLFDKLLRIEMLSGAGRIFLP